MPVQIDVDLYMEAARKATQLVWREGTVKYVKAAILRVAVDSGMSKGSFLRLGQLLGVSIPITPQAATPGNRIYRGRSGKERRPKTPEEGAKLSTQYGSVQDIVQIDGNKISFQFSSDVFQYFLQEFGFGNPSTQIPPPWHSLEDGKAAMLAYIRANLKKRLPDVRKFIRKV